MNSRASRFLDLLKENKEICGKNLGRMECSLWALPVSAMYCVGVLAFRL